MLDAGGLDHRVPWSRKDILWTLRRVMEVCRWLLTLPNISENVEVLGASNIIQQPLPRRFSQRGRYRSAKHRKDTAESKPCIKFGCDDSATTGREVRVGGMRRG